MYVRFVEALDADDAWQSDGVFTAAEKLLDTGKLHDYQVCVLQHAYDWFNENLPVPPFRRNQELGHWSEDAVCWFCQEAVVPISYIWDIVAILKDHGVAVRMARTTCPGSIVYRDDLQVVAIPERTRRRRRRR